MARARDRASRSGALVAALRAYISRIEALEPSLPRDPKTDKLIPEYRRLLLAARQADFRRPADLFDLLVRFEKATPKVVQKDWPGGKAQALAEEQAWAEFAATHAAPYLATWRAIRYRVVLRACAARSRPTTACAMRPAGSIFKTCCCSRPSCSASTRLSAAISARGSPIS